MLKPVCVKDQRFYFPRKNGVPIIEGKPQHGAKPGTAEPDKWTPYKLWMADVWECPECGHQIVIGATEPMAYDYQPQFKTWMEALQPELRVNDC